MLLNNIVERSTFLADVVATAWADDLRIEENHELLETAETMALVERSVFCQQLGPSCILFNFLLNSPVICTYGRLSKSNP